MYVTGFPISCTSQRSPSAMPFYHRPDIPDLNVPQCRTPGCTSHTHPPSVPPGLYQIASFSSSAPPRHHQASRVCFFFCPQQDNTRRSLLPITLADTACQRPFYLLIIHVDVDFHIFILIFASTFSHLPPFSSRAVCLALLLPPSQTNTTKSTKHTALITLSRQPAAGPNS